MQMQSTRWTGMLNIQHGLTCLVDTAGCHLEPLGFLPCVHSCKPNWLSFNMVVSGQSANGTVHNGLVPMEPQLEQLIPVTFHWPKQVT